MLTERIFAAAIQTAGMISAAQIHAVGSQTKHQEGAHLAAQLTFEINLNDVLDTCQDAVAKRQTLLGKVTWP